MDNTEKVLLDAQDICKSCSKVQTEKRQGKSLTEQQGNAAKNARTGDEIGNSYLHQRSSRNADIVQRVLTIQVTS